MAQTKVKNKLAFKAHKPAINMENKKKIIRISSIIGMNFAIIASKIDQLWYGGTFPAMQPVCGCNLLKRAFGSHSELDVSFCNATYALLLSPLLKNVVSSFWKKHLMTFQWLQTSLTRSHISDGQETNSSQPILG